ncbi:MAG: ATP-binding cassette domain-containing protein [Liquorilactobacillus hordei]|uniref:Oligopeptide transport ATP-binding protein amiF n=1 Tax=Liquorilactobacillus hordei DSM 19519 TaxID=1423759 RepID=A0A0R1MDK0_9LACO|nr:ATP-binding cassette domain-containing protein [Liquorilactobacillus hordei]KRL06175.1 oligopeptide transport ATP-binding protein amiF [Liquorilactobacillus hordei DSM 19519]QYH52336.1 ABC transporter ATP-binding protein [Liquorilactobacillus hordei DSM 19519]
MDNSTRETLLSIKDLEITFGTGNSKFVAVQDVNFDIFKGEIFSLVGESGSGKTTIGRAVLGINPTSNGQIIFEGKQINGKISGKEKFDIERKIQMIFQDPSASLNERATVDYIISEGLYNYKLFKNEEDRLNKVKKMLEAVGLLPEQLYRYPHEFSGGQRQRIGIARALIMNPDLVVADEPISALDMSIRAQVLNLLKKFQREQGVTFLFVAHDLSVVRYISDRIAVIRAGRILELAETEELFNNPIHPYTKSLLSAIPIPDPQIAKNRENIVYDPSIHNYSTEKPKFEEIKPGHFVYCNETEAKEYKIKFK